MRIKKLRAWRLLLIVAVLGTSAILMSSSHREAPLIADDPLADNTDVYAFRCPNAQDRICIIANYIPGHFLMAGQIITLLAKTSGMKFISIIISAHRVMILFTALLFSEKMKILLLSSTSGWGNKI